MPRTTSFWLAAKLTTSISDLDQDFEHPSVTAIVDGYLEEGEYNPTPKDPRLPSATVRACGDLRCSSFMPSLS